ncbi:hypothetical protein MWU52_11410 [Jannaschia sp. S6380]|nr:hypothetical protein [Jannaschia sp. S6380]
MTVTLVIAIAFCHLFLVGPSAWIGTAIVVALLYVPVTSAGVRRLHDAGFRGTLMLDPLVPTAKLAIVVGVLALVPPLSWLTGAIFGWSMGLAVVFPLPILVLAIGIGIGLAITAIGTLVAFTNTAAHLLLPSRRTPT